MTPERFLEELVRIPSLSGEEQAASEFAVAHMLALGYREAYVDAAGSAVGKWGRADSSKRIVLLGHIDTVPGVILVRVEDGVLHGRGSVDAKGPLATFISAVATLPPDLDAEIIVVGATEEEAASSKGARQALMDLSEPDFCIVGEPSGTSGVTLGYKGRLLVEIEVSRPMTHTAHAHVSVGEAAFAVHQAVLARVDQANVDKAGIFDRLDYSLRAIRTDSDGLTDRASMTLGFRLGPAFEPASLAHEIEEAARASLEPGFELGFETRGHELPVKRDRRNPLVAAFFAAIRASSLEPKTVVKTGTADMNVLSEKWSCPMVAYGPGDSALDHTPEERLELAEYRTAIEVLSQVLRRLTTGSLAT